MTLLNDDVMTKIGDVLSLSVLIGYFVSILPTIATVLTILWTLLRIYEMPTVQKIIAKLKGKTDEPAS